MRRHLLTLAFLPALASCRMMGPGEIVQTRTASPDWRQIATNADRGRLRNWRTAFSQGLQQARTAGHGRAIQAEGTLLMPDAALGGAPMPPGTYRCRIVKLGAIRPGMLPFVTYPAFPCRVRPEQGVLGFAKLSGSQRPVGLIFPNDQLRQVFLGSLVLGDETRAMQYGNDPERDLAGFLERIGDRRWRLLLPRPRFESLVDVVEIVPAA
jgi:hypothetical protein